MSNVGERLDWARGVSAEVGQLLLARRDRSDGTGLGTTTKDRGIVTDLDHQAELLIADSLAARFPEDGLEAEEGTRRPASGPYRWVVDPLDGTTNYAAGLPMFAVSLACLDDAGAVAGFIRAPALAMTFEAVRGAPSKPARPPTPGGGSLKEAVFIVNKAYAPSPVLWAVAGDLMSGVRAFRTLGCVSLDLALVAAGRADGLVLLPADPWDVAAGLLLAAGAGLHPVALDGSPDPDGRRGVLLTSDPLAAPALTLLHPDRLPPPG